MTEYLYHFHCVSLCLAVKPKSYRQTQDRLSDVIKSTWINVNMLVNTAPNVLSRTRRGLEGQSVYARDYCNSFLMQDADVLCANRKFELIPVNSISDRITACIIFSGLHFIVVCELHVYLMKIICLFVVLCPYLSYHACSDILSSWDTCNLYRLIVPYIFLYYIYIIIILYYIHIFIGTF